MVPMPLRHPLVASVSSALVVSASLAGCAVDGTQSQSCVEWVWFDSPAEAAAEADVVLRADGPASSSGTVELFGASATAHLVDVAEV
ncbi:MAG: hypothetical protein HGA44_21330, partial [Cellulomonadaceae bacterium]|nr:hypothetical protein [Cellulomonadaceae bacterium]